MMTRCLLSGCLAVVLGVASGAANAQTMNLGTLPILPALPLTGSVSDPVGAINDTLNFSFPTGASFDSAGMANFPVKLGSINLYDIAGLSATLYNGFNESGGVIGSLNTITPGVLQGSGSLTPGNYSFLVTGTASGSAGGLYVYTMAAAVPEVNTWAMMLTGLGLVALGIRRRQS